MSQRTSTRSTLQITLMNQRLVLTIQLARTDRFSGRSIHVNLNTMHSFVPAVDQQPDMPSLGPFWSFAQDTA